jgi:hypothetical protein
MTDMLKWGLMESGDCITLFTPGELNTRFTENLAIRWRWQQEGGFDNRLRKIISTPEIKEAFLTCLDIAESIFPHYPRGIRMHEEDKRFLEENYLTIHGGSLGLAFLFGLISHVHSRRPGRVVAWGTILPVRNNSFAVQPTDAASQKMDAARALGAQWVVHPCDEHTKPAEGIRLLRIKAPIMEAVRQLNTESLYEARI